MDLGFSSVVRRFEDFSPPPELIWFCMVNLESMESPGLAQIIVYSMRQRKSVRPIAKIPSAKRSRNFRASVYFAIDIFSKLSE